MDNSVFRKKSLDRANSPDALNNTIRVTQPAIWVVLVALVLVFVAFFIWAVYGTLNSTVNTVVVSSGDQAGCYVSEKNIMEVDAGMDVIVGDETYQLGEIVLDKCCFAGDVDDYVAHLGNYSDNEYLYYFTVLGNVSQGSYKGEIISEKINAISFLWNGEGNTN